MNRHHEFSYSFTPIWCSTQVLSQYFSSAQCMKELLWSTDDVRVMLCNEMRNDQNTENGPIQLMS